MPLKIFFMFNLNQQVSSLLQKLMFMRSPSAGKPFYLVGSDMFIQRTINQITKNHLLDMGGKLFKYYLQLGNLDVIP